MYALLLIMTVYYSQKDFSKEPDALGRVKFWLFWPNVRYGKPHTYYMGNVVETFTNPMWKEGPWRSQIFFTQLEPKLKQYRDEGYEVIEGEP